MSIDDENNVAIILNVLRLESHNFVAVFVCHKFDLIRSRSTGSDENVRILGIELDGVNRTLIVVGATDNSDRHVDLSPISRQIVLEDHIEQLSSFSSHKTLLVIVIHTKRDDSSITVL